MGKVTKVLKCWDEVLFQATFDVVMRILNREWNPRFANRNTQEFHQLAAEVINGVSFFFRSVDLTFF